MKVKLAICLSILAMCASAAAQQQQTFSFFRDADGGVSRYAKYQARQMLEYAKEHGQITLWLVLAYPYNPDTENMTPEEINTQDAEVSQGLSEILNPLVARGDVWHPPSGVFIRGPGCTVRATPKGLKRLLRDERLYQITTFDSARAIAP